MNERYRQCFRHIVSGFPHWLFFLQKIRGNLLLLSSGNRPEDKDNYFFEILVTEYQTTRLHVSEDSMLHSKRRETPLFRPNISVSVTLA